MRIYGAGILSSGSESRFSLEAQSPNRIHLNVDRVMRTAYKHDDLQQSYFIIDSFEELFKLTKERPFEQIYKTIGPSFQFAPSALLEIDHVYHNGTQEYHQRGGKPSSAVPV